MGGGRGSQELEPLDLLCLPSEGQGSEGWGSEGRGSEVWGLRGEGLRGVVLRGEGLRR